MRLFTRWILSGATAWLAILNVAVARPVEIVPPEFSGARQPQIAVSEDETIYVTFGRGEDVFVSVSRDQGRTFAAPKRVATLSGLALGMRRGPRVAVQGREVTVTAQNENLLAFHSSDGGENWSDAVRLNSATSSAHEGLHALAIGPDGRLFATWLDLRSGEMEVYGAASENAGRTWGQDSMVYRSPDGHVCECCHPSAAFNAAGDLAVMWRNWLDGSRDLWTAKQPAGKRGFESSTKQGTGSWRINACPMDGGAVFALEDGSFASVWRREGSVFLSRDSKPERLLGTGAQPFAVATRDGIRVFWQDGKNLVLGQDGETAKPALLATDAAFGAAVVLPRSQRIVLVFEGSTDGRESIFATVVP